MCYIVRRRARGDNRKFGLVVQRETPRPEKPVVMPKTTFLQIRITPEDRDRLHEVAAAEHLDVSTWARQVLLKAAEKLEGQRHRGKPKR